MIRVTLDQCLLLDWLMDNEHQHPDHLYDGFPDWGKERIDKAFRALRRRKLAFITTWQSDEGPNKQLVCMSDQGPDEVVELRDWMVDFARKHRAKQREHA